MARIVVVGEGMVELAPGEGAGGAGAAGEWRVGHGGDTLNIAIHLARLGHDVAFLTALGTDPFSAGLRRAWEGEGLDARAILTDPVRRAGLYAITNSPDGERQFTYWRADSAARALFAQPGADAAVERAGDAALLIFSMISLAILPPEGRDALLALAQRVRAHGGRVAFDTNYRPALWPDTATARAVHARAASLCDIALPTLEDEVALTGAATADDVLAAWRAAGVAEVVLKLGAEGCRIADRIVAPPQRLAPRDTSGAGDAFDAGYCHARLAGLAPADAARAGHRLAAWAVMRRGAIPPRDADAPYANLLA